MTLNSEHFKKSKKIILKVKITDKERKIVEEENERTTKLDEDKER